MTARTRPPFRADHVGSLLRPPRLLQAREDHAAGRIDDAELRGDRGRGDPRRRPPAGGGRAALGDRRRVPPRLLAHGLHLPARRRHAGAGRVDEGPVPQRRGHARVHAGRAARRRAGRARGADLRGRLRVPAVVRHDRDAEAHDPVAEHGPLPRRPGLDRRGRLPGPRRVLGRPAGAYAAEVRALADLGCTYLQFDDTSLAYLNDPKQRGDDREPRRRRRAPARALHPPRSTRRSRTARRSMAVTTHMCRGNFRSSWVAEGGYDFVAEALFGELAVDGFFMEWDDDALGRLRAAAVRPEGQGRRARPRDDEARRAREHATSSSAASRRRRSTSTLDQLCLSPQCGFSSTVEGNAITEEQQWDKLRLVVETAAEVWGD